MTGSRHGAKRGQDEAWNIWYWRACSAEGWQGQDLKGHGSQAAYDPSGQAGDSEVNNTTTGLKTVG